MTDKQGLETPVHVDVRGEIHRHDLQDVKFNSLFTKKGAYRSGDVHPVKQFDLLLSGKVSITFRENEQDVVRTFGPNELIVIPPNIPHLFYFEEDTVMLEWWDGVFEVSYYEPYRKFVKAQFE